MPMSAKRPWHEHYRRWFFSTLALLIAFQIATPAWAWGRLGYRLTARLAGLSAMDTSQARAKAMSGTVNDWATESLLAAQRAYQDPATGQRIKAGTKLG